MAANNLYDRPKECVFVCVYVDDFPLVRVRSIRATTKASDDDDGDDDRSGVEKLVLQLFCCCS